MNDYTLTTEEVRGLWVVTMFKRNALDANRNLTTYRDEFDRWLDEVRAEAWDEGHEAAAMRIPEGVWHDTASAHPTNPYRQEPDT